MAGWVSLPSGLAPDEEACSLRVCVQQPVNAVQELVNQLPKTIADFLRCQL